MKCPKVMGLQQCGGKFVHLANGVHRFLKCHTYYKRRLNGAK